MKKSIFGIIALVALSLLVGCVENTGPKLQATGFIDPSNPTLEIVVINFNKLPAGVVIANNSNPTPTIGTIIVTYTNPSCSFNYYPNINAQGSVATSGAVLTPAYVASRPEAVALSGINYYVMAAICPLGNSSDYTVSYTINGKTYSISGNIDNPL